MRFPLIIIKSNKISVNSVFERSNQMFPWNSNFPFNKDIQKITQQLKPEELTKFMEELFGKFIPNEATKMNHWNGFFNPLNERNSDYQTTASQSPKLDSHVFETNQFVFIQIPIREEDWLKQIKIAHTAYQLCIEHIPELKDKHKIILPASVKRKGATAQYKNNTIEIQLEKDVENQYSEIDVDH